MDTQLQELIDAIKTEGVQTAEKQAEQIIAAAEENAREIVSGAESRAKGIVEAAKAEQQKLDQSGREALIQAGRDLILSVQAQISQMFSAVVSTATSEAISADILENAIVTVVNAWSQGSDDPLEVLLSESDLGRLEQRLRNRLSEKIGSGVEVRAAAGIRSGFRVSTRDGSLYYDFTVDTIAEALSQYIGPRLTEILKEAASAATA